VPAIAVGRRRHRPAPPLRAPLRPADVNYAAVVALSLAAALLAHPFSLAALLALLAAWCLLYILTVKPSSTASTVKPSSTASTVKPSSTASTASPSAAVDEAAAAPTNDAEEQEMR
jgi:hypothetical protein